MRHFGGREVLRRKVVVVVPLFPDVGGEGAKMPISDVRRREGRGRAISHVRLEHLR